MDYFISCVDLGEFDVTSKDGSLTLTTGVSLFFRGSEDGEEEMSLDRLHQLVAGGLGFSGATSCRITFCPLIQGIPMHREYLGPDGCGFVQVLAHLVEDLYAWQKLGLRLGPTAKLYSHDESSVSFNYRVEHMDLELPSPISTDSLIPELESVRCHLNFSVQVPGIAGDSRGRDPRRQAPRKGKTRKRGGGVRTLAHEDQPYHGGPRMMVFFSRSNNGYGLTAKREVSIAQHSVSRKAATPTRKEALGVTVKREESLTDVSDHGLAMDGYQNMMAGMEVSTVSDHPELETIVRDALNHMLLGSRPRGARVSEGFMGKALTKVAPAVFDTDRLRGVAVRMPLIDSPASAVSYFAANAKSPSLKKSMQALALSDGAHSNSGAAPTRLAVTRLRELVCRDSKPISPKSSQSSGGSDMMPPLLNYDSSQLGAFSEIGIGEEMLLPGDWPLNQVSSLNAEGVGNGFTQDVMPPPGVVETYTTEWVHHPSKADLSLSDVHSDGVTAQMGMLGMMQVQECGSIPEYFEEYHDRLLHKEEEYSDMVGDPYPSASSQVMVLNRTCICGRIFACEGGGSQESFTCGLHGV